MHMRIDAMKVAAVVSMASNCRKTVCYTSSKGGNPTQFNILPHSTLTLLHLVASTEKCTLTVVMNGLLTLYQLRCAEKLHYPTVFDQRAEAVS